MSFFSNAFKWLGGNSLGANLAKTAILGYTSRLLSDNVNDTTSTEAIDEGVRLQLNPSTENKIPVLYGDAYFSGNITDASLSPDYKQMRYCLALSELTGNTLDATPSTYTFNDVYFNNNRVVFKADGFTLDHTIDSSGNQDPSAEDLIKVYLYKEGTALNGGPSPETLLTHWTNHPMTNLLYAIVEVNYNRAKNVTGLPQCIFHISNSLDMPGDVLNDYMTNTSYGAGIDTGDISGLVELNANVLNGFTYTDASGSQQVGQTRINGLVSTTTNVLTNIEAMTKACSSWLSYDIHQGRWVVIINESGASTASFTDSNIIGEISVSGSSLTGLYNSAEVKYQNTDILDKADFVRIDIPAGDLFANEPNNTVQIVLPFTNKQSTALKVGLIELKQSRIDKIISFKSDYSYLNVKAGDLIDVTSPAFNYTNKVFRVVNVKEVETNNTIVLDFKCIEYDADVYTYDIAEYEIETDDGLLSIGSIGKPNTPTVTNNDTGSNPHILMGSVVPSGIVDEMEFWVTHDTSVPNDYDRTYVKVGTQSNTDGSTYTENQAVSYQYGQLNQGDLYVKVRGMNNITSGPFSDPSGLIAYVPVQEPDNIPDGVSIGGQLMSLGIMTLLNNLDVLFDGDPNTSLVDAILDDFFPSRNPATPMDEQIKESLINDQGFIDGVSAELPDPPAPPAPPQLITELSDVDTTTVAPVSNDVLYWDGVNWVPGAIDPDGQLPDPIYGCIDPTALNYDAGATHDDESCLYQCYMSFIAAAPNISISRDNEAPYTGSYFVRFTPPSAAYSTTTFTLLAGNIKLYRSDGTLEQSILASDCILHNKILEIPFADRTLSTDYYILIDDGIIATACTTCNGLTTHLSTGISTPSWTFTTSEFENHRFELSGDDVVDVLNGNIIVLNGGLPTYNTETTTDYIGYDTFTVDVPGNDINELEAGVTPTLTYASSPKPEIIVTGNVLVKDPSGAVVQTLSPVSNDGQVVTLTDLDDSVIQLNTSYTLTFPFGFLTNPDWTSTDTYFDFCGTQQGVPVDTPMDGIQSPLYSTSFAYLSDVKLAVMQYRVSIGASNAAQTIETFDVNEYTTGVVIEESIEILFNKNISESSVGNFKLYNGSGSLIQSFNTTTTFNNNQTDRIISETNSSVVLDLTYYLDYNTEYYILIDFSAVLDDGGGSQQGTPFSGLTDVNGIRFLTDDGPSIMESGQNDGVLDTIEMEFDRPIQKGSGVVTVRDDQNNIVQTFDVTDPSVTIEE